jgi:transposase
VVKALRTQEWALFATCSRSGQDTESGHGKDACQGKHINASLNLLRTAISEGLEVAGGSRFNPGAFQHDVMMILYEPVMAARSEPNGTSCIGWVA